MGPNWERFRDVYRKKLHDMTEHEYVCVVNDWEQEPVNGFIEVPRLGAGAMLIKRRALAAMCGYYPNLAFGSPTGDTYHGLFKETTAPGFVSEDYSFCKRWREVGGGGLFQKVYLYTRSALICHAGSRTYSARDIPGAVVT